MFSCLLGLVPAFVRFLSEQKLKNLTHGLAKAQHIVHGLENCCAAAPNSLSFPHCVCSSCVKVHPGKDGPSAALEEGLHAGPREQAREGGEGGDLQAAVARLPKAAAGQVGPRFLFCFRFSHSSEVRTINQCCIVLLGFRNSGVVAAVENDDGIPCAVGWQPMKCFRDSRISSL